MQGKFTQKAKEVIEYAQESAVNLGHNYVGTEHLLLGLSGVSESVAAKALEAQGVGVENIEEKIEEMVGPSSGTKSQPIDFTPRTKRVLEASLSEAVKMGTGYIGTEHLLLALLREPESIAVRILASLNVNPQKLYEDIMAMVGETEMQGNAAPINTKGNKKGKSNTPTLDQYSRDFTSLAGENKFDPIVGRDKEIERVIQILSRRTKNNPVLVGDPGVGKTAIVEGLAQKNC